MESRSTSLLCMVFNLHAASKLTDVLTNKSAEQNG